MGNTALVVSAVHLKPDIRESRLGPRVDPGGGSGAGRDAVDVLSRVLRFILLRRDAAFRMDSCGRGDRSMDGGSGDEDRGLSCDIDGEADLETPRE